MKRYLFIILFLSIVCFTNLIGCGGNENESELSGISLSSQWENSAFEEASTSYSEESTAISVIETTAESTPEETAESTICESFPTPTISENDVKEGEAKGNIRAQNFEEEGDPVGKCNAWVKIEGESIDLNKTTGLSFENNSNPNYPKFEILCGGIEKKEALYFIVEKNSIKTNPIEKIFLNGVDAIGMFYKEFTPNTKPTYTTLGGWIEFCAAQEGHLGWVIGDFNPIFPLGISKPIDVNSVPKMEVKANYEALVSGKNDKELYIGISYGYAKGNEDIDFNSDSYSSIMNDDLFLEIIMGQLYPDGEGVLFGIIPLEKVNTSPVSLEPLDYQKDINDNKGKAGFWLWKSFDDFFDGKLPDYDICSGTFTFAPNGLGINSGERSIGKVDGKIAEYGKCGGNN